MIYKSIFLLWLLNPLMLHCMEYVTNKDNLRPLVHECLELAKAHQYNPQSPLPIVAIAGCSAVGKTYFSNYLVQLLKDEHVAAAILHLDDFMQMENAETFLTIQPRFDYMLAHAKIKEILAGNLRITKPTWSEDASSKFDEVLELKDVNLLIFEGEYTLSDAQTYDFLKYSSLRIFMQARDEDMLEWNWKRGRATQGQTKEEFFVNMAKAMQHYHTYIEPTQQHARYIIFHNAEHQYSLQSNDHQTA